MTMLFGNWFKSVRLCLDFSAINFATMSHAINSHNSNRIGNLVDHTISADANPPVVLRSRKFAAANRPRIGCEIAQCIRYAESHIERESSEVLLSRTLDDDAIHRLALREIGKHVLQWTEVKLFLARAFQPGNIFGILKALDHLLIFLDRQNNRNGFPIARNDFRFSIARFHKRNLSGSRLRVNLRTRLGELSRFLLHSDTQRFVLWQFLFGCEFSNVLGYFHAAAMWSAH